MNPFHNSSTVEQLLARFTGPVRAVRTKLFVRDKGAERVVQDTEDRTEIGASGAIETVVSREANFYDCGHFAADNLGGRCECGALVCTACLTHCARCGAALCPKHRKQGVESDAALCPPCHRETTSRRRLKKAAISVASLFAKRGKKE